MFRTGVGIEGLLGELEGSLGLLFVTRPVSTPVSALGSLFELQGFGLEQILFEDFGCVRRVVESIG